MTLLIILGSIIAYIVFGAFAYKLTDHYEIGDPALSAFFWPPIMIVLIIGFIMFGVFWVIVNLFKRIYKIIFKEEIKVEFWEDF